MQCTLSDGSLAEVRQVLPDKVFVRVKYIDSLDNPEIPVGDERDIPFEEIISEDNGKTFEERDNGMATKDIYGVNCVQAGGELRVYAGTEPAHLYVSKDKGHSWAELPQILNQPSREKWTFPAPPHEAHVKNIV